MRITLLKVSNFQKIKDIEIEPGERSLMLIAGYNKQGKTSLLRSISSALGGGKEKPANPVRMGEERAEIVVELDNGAIRVTRVFGENGSTSLKVVSEEFGKVASPQSVLDKIVGERFLDPLEFARLVPKQQRAKLLEVVDVGIDLDACEADRKRCYEERTHARRDVKRLKAELGAIGDGTAEIPKKIDMPKLVLELEGLQAREARAADAARAIEQCNRTVASARHAVAAAESALAEANHGLSHAIEFADGESKRLHSVAQDDVSAEIESVKAKLSDCDSHNSTVAKMEARQAFHDATSSSLLQAEKVAAEQDRIIAAIDKNKSDALAYAKMPVPGLTIGDDLVMFNGVPLSQICGSERLEVSLAIAASTKPKLRDIWIEEGALIDTEHGLATIAKFAESNKLCVWLERVGEDHDNSIIIRDGSIAGVEDEDEFQI
jgi:hypothetical protein